MISLIKHLLSLSCLLFFTVAIAGGIYLVALNQDLPNHEVLSSYEPPVESRVHADDGSLLTEFAHERRLFLPIQSIPDRVKEAFISAEDKNFYSHAGIDVAGIGRAILKDVENFGSGRPLRGASTITQQVAKNFFLSKDQTFNRKVKEAILTLRIEQTYSKDKILELYLNQIPFGMRAFGVASAALAYYGKPVTELTVAEAAYLAALPKAPYNYDPYRHTQAALVRRNWVIDRMAENGYITNDEAEVEKAKPLDVKTGGGDHDIIAADYFSDEVRRQLIDQFGEKELYEGGLSVRTSIVPDLQNLARKALQKGLVEFDQRRGFHGILATVDISGDWGSNLLKLVSTGKVPDLNDVPEWTLAVVLDVSPQSVEIGLRPETDRTGPSSRDRQTGTISAADMKWAFHDADNNKTAKSPNAVLKRGDVIYVERVSTNSHNFLLRQAPRLQGGFVAMDPKTGRVLALTGGFSHALSKFNRATQAMRQPGSSFKPFVYASALDSGYTPASVILDAPISIANGGEVWSPDNYGNEGSNGPSTLRFGIEHSRNQMTVRLAQDMGMDLVAQYAERFGIYDKMPTYLPMALGAGETTVMRLVSAYAVIADGGKQIKPTLIDRVQDRYGKTIFRHDDRVCNECNAVKWEHQKEPTLVDNREQVLDPMTAYQITTMMEGVVQRGTAAGTIHISDRPVAGKTGTSNDSKDVWFVGFTPNLVAGVYIGFDTPASLGRTVTGGTLAAPIFAKFMEPASKLMPAEQFHVPQGMTFVAVNRKTGMKAQPDDPDAITEAFKPGTGPSDGLHIIGDSEETMQEQNPDASPQAEQAVKSGASGLF